MKQYLEAGQIVSTHGIRGELKVMPWCDSAAFFCKLKTLYDETGTKPVKVIRAREQKNMVLLQLEGIETVEQADALRNRVLYLNRDEVKLPEGACFQQDLLGLTVSDADNGTVYGKITDIIETGANDCYEITDKAGKAVLFPAVASMIVSRDLEAGTMTVRPIPGIFDDAD